MAGSALMYNYMITRTFGESDDYDSSLSVSDRDPINCAHLLASGFNTLSRNVMNDFVLAVVDTKTGTVQYDGKVEKIDRPEPHTVSTSFKFEASTDADTMVTIFDNENGRLMFPGKLKFAATATDDEVLAKATADLTKAAAGKLARSVLEDAYVELLRVKDVLFDAGVETIPADAGVRELVRLNEQLPAAAQDIADHVQANAAARAELIKHVKGAYEKWSRIDPERERDDLKSHLRGMIEVLSRFLVVIGEAEDDERHAVAKRLCGIPEGTYLYDIG